MFNRETDLLFSAVFIQTLRQDVQMHQLVHCNVFAVVFFVFGFDVATSVIHYVYNLITIMLDDEWLHHYFTLSSLGFFLKLKSVSID